MPRIRLPRHEIAFTFWARTRYIVRLPIHAGNDLDDGRPSAYGFWTFGRRDAGIEIEGHTAWATGFGWRSANVPIPADIDPRDVGAVARFLSIVADHDPRFADAPGLVIAGIRNIADALTE